MGNRLLLGLIAGVTLAAFLAGCGGSDDDSTTSSQSTPAATSAAATTAPTGASAAAATTAPAPAAAAAPQAIAIKAGDFFYEPSTLSVKSGAVVVTLQNTSDGNRPHTFVVKKKDGSDMAKTDRIAPGQSGTLEFTVSEAGTYEYYCNLPGHADRGQKGTLTVTAS